jgi:hypothetical protein
MNPLPTRLLAAALLGCAAIVTPASARSPDAATAPLDAAAPFGAATFGDGTLHPWGPPPLPPLPAAELWGDYHQPPIGHRLHRAHGHACGQHHQYPVLSFVGGVVDGFVSLLTYPVRKAHAQHSCHTGPCDTAAGWHGSAVLRDCGCYPAPHVERIIDAQPLIVPSPPPDQATVGPPPQPLAEPMPLEPIEPAPVESQPQRLHPGRGPVVELAPELTIPVEPDPLPPRNAIPSPGVRVPRNVIP